MVETFADQAVIAIENVRLFEAEQERSRELSQSLEQQTATSEVLQVISSSPGDLEPVFETMLAKAVRICDANSEISSAGTVKSCTSLRRIIHRLPSLKLRKHYAASSQNPPVGRMVATKAVIHVADLAADAGLH